ncbi:PIN domain-containing protein [Paenibacillus cremeus]|uniref:PIN domain-containing protein n=1 Tax=Paenibacillus cremeus TaxID=2163881 RepID=A0A559K385_9BACL|nr:PIN domain-containing protein [Paenibacillus cremeus]TVY06576.1 hypothetical protein FPZ49_28685 [Paenibacillus cremeus]
MSDISIFSASWRLVLLVVVLKIILFTWELSFFIPRKPRQMNNLLPKDMPEAKKSLSSNNAFDVLATYLETGHLLAVDAQFLLKYHNQIFNSLHLIFQFDGGKLMISEPVMNELEELRTKTHTGIAANNLIESIRHAQLNYPKRLEIKPVDVMLLSTFGIDEKSKAERELSPYVLAQHYRLTNVVLLSQDPEKRNRASRLGLMLHPF